MDKQGNKIRSSDDTCYITVTDESDLESERLPPCDPLSPKWITVKNATDTLNLGGLAVFTGVQSVDVAQSPQLQVLDFPQIEYLYSLKVQGADALSSIFLSDISSPPPEIWDNGYSIPPGLISIDIADGSSLFELDLPKATGLHELLLRNITRFSWSNPNITSIVILESDVCLSLPALATTRNIHLTGKSPIRTINCFGMVGLTSVYNFTLTNIGPGVMTFGSNELTVRDTLVLESTILDPYYYYDDDKSLELTTVTSVGSNAYITSNANMHIDISALESVKGNLSISNNRNCTFNFDHLEEVGNLILTDNPDTSLSSFPSLKRANNIHLRGRIAQSNIFPALIGVSGKVTIEAWNEDFNCSKLVSQQRNDIIYNLSCNGTSNGIQVNDPTSIPAPSSSPSGGDGLSAGAKAGIGVGVTVAALGAIVVIVWLVLRFKLRRAALVQNGPSYTSFAPSFAAAPVSVDDGRIATGAHTPKAQGGEGAQEKPDDQVFEAEGKAPISARQCLEGREMMIRDKSESESHEMPSLFVPPELAAGRGSTSQENK